MACIDVGGTSVKTGVYAEGRFTEGPRLSTPPAGAGAAEAVVDLVAEIVAQTRSRVEVDAVGLVVPGVVDAANGIAVRSQNLGWRDARFGAMVEERTGLPVAFGHDVRAGALAEAREGAGVGFEDVLFVPIGTGIAAGLVLGGMLHERGRPTGEIGHVGAGSGEPCSCGLAGCLETVASAAAIARRYAGRTGRQVTARDVAALVEAGDADAAAVWRDAVEALGATLAAAVGLIGPDVIVVGGGLATSGDVLLAPLRDAIAARLAVQQPPAVVPAALGDLAGARGAGLLALDLMEVAS